MSAVPGPAELRDRAADRAIFGDAFSAGERRHARELGLDLDAETESLELAAAMVALAAPPAARADIPVEMPAHLRARLHALAREAADPPKPIPIDRGRSGALALAWTVAAASIAVAVASNWSLLAEAVAPRASDEGGLGTAGVAPDRFLAAHPRALRAAFVAGDDGHARRDARGEACFDPETGEGVLVIEGLVPNDPKVEQYQLWIFDARRDERYPVDGGVFDMGPSGRAVIPVRAKLGVTEPTLFAVTVEPPGGSVVSERRIALVARPSSGR